MRAAGRKRWPDAAAAVRPRSYASNVAASDQAPLTALDFDALYAEGFGRVYGFALRMLGDRDAALDAAQETFARAVAAAPAFRGESAPLTWLFSIARNLCLARLQRERERTFEEFEALIEANSEAPTAGHSEFERRMYIEEVKEGCLTGLLGCLTVAQRTVFVLHLLNGVPIPDVARVMGRSPNAVRILLSRARKGLRGFLCANCEWVGATTCRCVNLVEFALRRDLIERIVPELPIPLPAFRDELRRFADEVELYRSLPDQPAASAIGAAVASGRYATFRAE